MNKERADKILVKTGLAESRHQAQALIMAGLVYKGEEKVEKAGQLISVEENLSLKETLPYVSRGGLKLEEAVNFFKLPVKGKAVADLGASTGGFTDCLLQKGAQRVYAVDVDTRQIDWNLRKNPKVILIEKNARYLTKEDFQEIPDLVTMDLSFISVLKVLPAVKGFLGKGEILCLVKPQFEVGKQEVGKKGIVRDPGLHQRVLVHMKEQAEKIGFSFRGVRRSSLQGQKGNQEFFILWSLEKEPVSSSEVKTLIKEAVHGKRN